MPGGDADLELAGRASGARDRYRFETVDGVCSSDAFRTAELLLVEELWDRDVGRLLVPQANYGVVSTVLADAPVGGEPVGQGVRGDGSTGVEPTVVATESSASAAALVRENARRNDVPVTVDTLAGLSSVDEPVGVAGAGAESGADPVDGFETVAYAPKPYTAIDVGRQRIADSLATLSPGGTCFVAAATRTGLSRYEDCLDELTGDAETVATLADHSLVTATRPAEFDPPAYVTPTVLEPTVDGVDIELVSVPGLFAAGGLDHGTRLLLETVTVPDGARVLDVCCGYGPAGVFAATVADCEVTLTDDDRVATACAERSLARSGLDGTVFTGDCSDAVADRQFDLVLCNPPTHASAATLSRLFEGIRGVLACDGECLLVHHRDLDLSGHLRGFADRRRVASGEDHHVVRVTR